MVLNGSGRAASFLRNDGRLLIRFHAASLRLGRPKLSSIATTGLIVDHSLGGTEHIVSSVATKRSLGVVRHQGWLKAIWLIVISDRQLLGADTGFLLD